MIMASTNNFMRNTDLTEETSFTHLIDFMNPNEENETELLDNSMYYNDNNFKITLEKSHKRLSMVSLNCQSINAKFDQFKLFLADINSDSPISVICIQETWGHEGIDMTAFSLPNYAMVY